VSGRVSIADSRFFLLSSDVIFRSNFLAFSRSVSFLHFRIYFLAKCFICLVRASTEFPFFFVFRFYFHASDFRFRQFMRYKRTEGKKAFQDYFIYSRLLFFIPKFIFSVSKGLKVKNRLFKLNAFKEC